MRTLGLVAYTWTAAFTRSALPRATNPTSRRTIFPESLTWASACKYLGHYTIIRYRLPFVFKGFANRAWQGMNVPPN
eukprot:4482264-Pyramimonas_sp.AAC.1